MKKTKIVCTLGPAVDDFKVLSKLCLSGMDVARFNFSHGDYESQQKRIDVFKEVRNELNLPIPMMLDTKGPEIRIGTFENDQAFLNDGSLFTLSHEVCEGNAARVYVNYDRLYEDVLPGSTILINDGLIELEVIEIVDKDIKCRIVHGGKLTNRKSVNVPGLKLNLPLLTEKDKNDIIYGIENGFEIIAASFVRKAEDILAIREVLKEHHAENIKIISKIENQEGVDNFDEILKVSDGIMVARGDLGVEIAMERVPTLQKIFINKCNDHGKIVIVATQMLESMTVNPRPTRAEVNDVANAVFDGASCVMLSGEVAMGNYPIESVQTMSQIVQATEAEIDYWEKLARIQSDWLIGKKSNLIVGHALCDVAMQSGAEAIFSLSSGGHTPMAISSFKPNCPIYAITPNIHTARQLNAVWGITPILVHESENSVDMIQEGIKIAKENNYVIDGQTVVIGESDTYTKTSSYGVSMSKNIGGIYVL